MISAFTSAICTLFEGHYHFGVAALTNSLYTQGYRGDIFAGYRGDLPEWSANAKENSDLLGKGGSTLTVGDGLRLHFIPLDTDYHFTNYKPDFMLDVWNGPAREAQSLFYFDPDIIVTAPWDYFLQWVQYGVALCEDVNSPLPENHPRRSAWREYYGKKGIRLAFKGAIYVNGGYIGLSKINRNFLQIWKEIQELMAPVIGGLSCSALSQSSANGVGMGPFSPFGKTDQDALNATVEAWEGALSFVGKEGMSITSGLPLMPHAIGHPKPWRWSPIMQALAGRPPRRVDQEYWKNAKGILVAHSAALVMQKLFAIKIGALIGRFYRRS